MKPKKKDPNIYPPGWDAERVRRVIAHYENQTEDEAVAEDEAAWRGESGTVVSVPPELMPAVRALIARQSRQSETTAPKARRRRSA